MGFPLLAQLRQLVGGKTPGTCGGSNYRATQASAQENHKMGLYGCVLLRRYQADVPRCATAPSSPLKNALNY